MSERTVITFGTFDVFHVGHIRVLQRAAALGDRLVVGVSADALNIAKKGRAPVYTQEERMEIVASLRVVDEVFVEESLELKRDYILQFGADVLVMGDDWAGKFDWVSDVCEVVYLPRTPSVSTTGIIEHIASLGS
jgi:glycerol-3-phosphate cytidylyltransferase